MGGRGGGGKGGGGGGSGGKAKAAQNKSLVKSYTSGKSLSQVAKDHGLSKSTVHQRLVNQGVQLRGRGRR